MSQAQGSHFSDLSPLPQDLSKGLIPVAVLGILSFTTATCLLFLLTYRMIQWARKRRHANQFIILIYNLLLADIQQASAFLLNAEWLVQNGIQAGTKTCFAQGCKSLLLQNSIEANLTLGFVSTGDLGSGVWAFAIGLHTFACVIFGYRLSTPGFLAVCALLWVFIYAAAVIGVAMHPDLYGMAVAWCWIRAEYSSLRLWAHYFWIFVFEFGTVIVYGTMILAVRVRISTNFYRSKQQARHAEDAAKLMLAYPVIYVVCTLPLATLRMYSMRNPDENPSRAWFCFAGAMITSNGWLDVILYTLTRRIELFNDEPPLVDNGLDSFGTPWSKPSLFGTETLCEHVKPDRKSFRDSNDTEIDSISDPSYHRHSRNDLLAFVNMTKQTTVEVKSAPMTASEALAAKSLRDGSSMFPGSSTTFNSRGTGTSHGSRGPGISPYGSTRELLNHTGSLNSPGGTNSNASVVMEDDYSLTSPQTDVYRMDNLTFLTKPGGY